MGQLAVKLKKGTIFWGWVCEKWGIVFFGEKVLGKKMSSDSEVLPIHHPL